VEEGEECRQDSAQKKNLAQSRGWQSTILRDFLQGLAIPSLQPSAAFVG
jgi:hypothetical protein